MLRQLAKQILPGAFASLLLATAGGNAYAATHTQLYSAADRSLAYLTSLQAADGSIPGAFGSQTEWAIIAARANGTDPATIKSAAGNSLIDALAANGASESTPALDVALKMLAIAAARQDTADFAGVNYAQLLTAAATADQIGDTTQLNDDVFGILAISASGDESLYPLAAASYRYLIEHQAADGGFSWATSDHAYYFGSEASSTAAVILALVTAERLGVADTDGAAVTQKAIQFLLSTRQPSGGFAEYPAFSLDADSSATTWATIALNALDDSYDSARQAAIVWLLSQQNDDGGFAYGAFGMTDSNPYDSANSIVALLGTTWLLDPAPVARPNATTPQPDAGGSTDASAAERTPTIIQPVVPPAPLAPAQNSANNTAQVARPPAVAGSTTVESPAASDSAGGADGQSDDTVVTRSPSSLPASRTAASPWFRYLGYGLIAAAIVGFAGYVAYTRRTVE